MCANPTSLTAPFTANLSAQTPAGPTAFSVDSGSPSPGYWPWGTGTWGEQGPWGEWGTVQLQLADGDAVSVSSEHLSPVKGALAFRFTRHFDTGSQEIVLACGTDGSGTDWLQLSIDATDHLVMTWTADGGTERSVTSLDTLSTGIEYFLSFEWQHTMMALAIGSDTKVTGTRDAPEGSWGAGDLVLEADS